MPNDQDFLPKWKLCANCRKVRFLEPPIVVDGHRETLYVTACSACRRRTARWMDTFLASQHAAMTPVADVPEEANEL